MSGGVGAGAAGSGGAARRALHEMERLAARRYPSFVYARDPEDVDPGYLPVFTFHTLEPAGFEAALRHLERNGYRTLSMDRALEHLRGERPAPRRSVVLTVDDGRASTWTVGAPLLERFGMTATAFVVPGYLEEGPPRPPVAAGSETPPDGAAASAEAATEDAVTEARDRRRFMRWSEVERLHRDGPVAVESHTLLHRRVTVSGRLVGFVEPEPGVAPFDIPLPRGREEGWSAADLRRRLGAPIFEHDAVLGTPRAVEVPEGVVERCTGLVRREGGARFFERRGWRRRLRREVGAAGEDGFRPYDTRSLQRHDLVAGREALEDRLEGKRVRHLCFPSGRSSPRAVELAREAGYATGLCGLLDGDAVNRPGSDPMRIERMKGDFVHRLPGEGRRSLAEILARKAWRRLQGETGY